MACYKRVFYFYIFRKRQVKDYIVLSTSSKIIYVSYIKRLLHIYIVFKP